MPPFEPEEFQDVFRPIGVHPFLEVAGRIILGEKEGRKAATQKATFQVSVRELGQILGDHGGEPELTLSAGERVPEARRRPEGRRTGGDDFGVGVMGCGDRQNLRRMHESVDLVQDKSPAPQFLEKGLRVVLDHAPYPRQFAIKKLGIRKAPAQHCLAHSADAGEPEHRLPVQGCPNLLLPETTLYHVRVVLHMVLPNATLIAFGISQTLRGPGGVGECEGRAEGKEKESNWLPAPDGGNLHGDASLLAEERGTWRRMEAAGGEAGAVKTVERRVTSAKWRGTGEE